MKYLGDAKIAELKLKKIEKIVTENSELFLDSIDKEILDIINV